MFQVKLMLCLSLAVAMVSAHRLPSQPYYFGLRQIPKDSPAYLELEKYYASQEYDQDKLLEDYMLPKNFDSRTKWPNCTTIGQIFAQGSCGSCWTFGTATSISDRLCIHSNGKINVQLSEQELLDCCIECQPGFPKKDGGYPELAFKYFVEKGLTTNDCKPYHCANSKRYICEHKCTNSQIDFNTTRYHGKSFHRIEQNDNKRIQKEIFLRGPVEASLDATKGLKKYHQGDIYECPQNDSILSHSVRIIGWGEDEETKKPYWLVANSWGTGWGDGGYFRVARGENDCLISTEVVYVRFYGLAQLVINLKLSNSKQKSKTKKFVNLTV